LQGLRELSFQCEHALMCFPRIQAFDRLRGRYESFANCGAVAGALARMDAYRSPWDAGPDEQLLLRPCSRPLQVLKEAECQRLSAHGINPLQSMRAAVPGCMPLRTLARGAGLGPDSTLLTARRRQLLTINSLEQGTRWARFEGRDRNSWPRLTRQVRAFLLSLAASGGLGKSPDAETGEICCDESLNTPHDLAEGVVNCLVSLPTLRAGEFRSFVISHRREGSTVRAVTSPRLPGGAKLPVREPPRPAVIVPVREETAPRRTLAQELFGAALDARANAAAAASGAGAAEATAARRLDLNLVARLYGEIDRRGQRF
jgi:hypothetical protein